LTTFTITASTEIMHDMVARMTNSKVGLVHQLPFTTDQTGFAAAIEKVSQFWGLFLKGAFYSSQG